MQKNEASEVFELGTQVEVSRNATFWRKSWHKATIIKPPKPDNFSNIHNGLWVEYDTILDSDDPSKKLQEFTHTFLIRPLPPTPSEDTHSFEKYDFVDAYHKDAWLPGVILDVINDGLRYLVAFIHPCEQCNQFMYERDQIRVQLKWLGGGKWTQRYLRKNNVPFRPPDVGENVVASLFESTPAVDSPKEQTPSPSKRLKHSGDAEGRLSSELQYSDDSHSRSPAKANQITEVVNVINEPAKVIDEHGDCRSKTPVSYSEPATTECPKACPITICYSRRSNKSKKWPFTKRSSIWKVFESMEAFKRVPQMPHFFPLRKLEENSREMLAISLMMNFSYVAERILARSPDDLNNSIIIQETLKSLEELESHGFNITPFQDYLIELFLKMEKEKELNGNLEEIESSIIKCQDEKTAAERKLSELAKQLKSLQEQIQLEKSMKYLKDRHLAILESHRGIISRKLQLIVKPAFKCCVWKSPILRELVGCEKTAIERKVSELANQMKSLQEQFQYEKLVKWLKDPQLVNLESPRGIISKNFHNFQLTKNQAFEWYMIPWLAL